VDDTNLEDYLFDLKFKKLDKENSEKWLCPYCLHDIGNFLNNCENCDKGK
jgi:hypothetical protein